MIEHRYFIPSMADCYGCYYTSRNWSNPERVVVWCKHYDVETKGTRCRQCHDEFPLGGAVVVITKTKKEVDHDQN